MDNIPKMTFQMDRADTGAIELGKKMGNMFITPEHLLLSFIDQGYLTFPLMMCGGDDFKLKKELDSYIGGLDNKAIEEFELPFRSVQYVNMLDNAYRMALSCGKEEVARHHAIRALLDLPESMAAYLLHSQIDDENMFMSLIPAVENKSDDEEEDEGIDEPFDVDDMDDYAVDDDDEMAQPMSWRSLVTNVNEEVGKHNPLIGRTEELDRIMQILCRRDKNNPILIGEPGVGKTAIVYGLVERMIKGECPKRLCGCKVYMMDMGSMIAGTQYRGEFEKKLKLVLEGARKEGNTIIYIDEIHSIMGAGKISDGSLDASNMLKPYLEGGDIRFIGTTTYEEYNKHMAGSVGITRRFQQVDIAEPSVEDTIKIMLGLKQGYEKYHGIVIKNDIIDYAVRACAQHIPDRRFPDKAIDIIDEAGAYLELHPKNRQTQYLDKAIVNMVMSKLCKIDAEVMKTEDNSLLATLKPRMLSRVFGQDEAVGQVVEAVQMSKAGLIDSDKPLASLLFVGPTGVGKTEVARSLADELGVELVRFDMSEYAEKHAVAKLIGSPAGYVGYEDGGLLTDAIRKKPNCVLLFDEIEKAHSDIYNILLQVMDYAKLTDNRGRQADFHNVVIIMTSNAGAQYASQASVGFLGGVSKGEAMMKQVKKSFKPEFINRLSATVVFHDMSHDMATRILHKKLAQLQQKLAAKNVTIDIEGNAEEWLLAKGFTTEYGAREMDRVIARYLKPLLMHEILFGSLKKGGNAKIVINDNNELELCKKKN
ncbi:aTP-dependent Clp protease ATP-binding subunit ClpA [Prevotella sp. CAG:1092]|nr:aTP-dependent Clp protease ATP-binding subunit ClpA [Prevotella sp. CAG:1092]